MAAAVVLVTAMLAASQAAPAPRAQDCLRALVSVESGSIPRSDAFERIACPDAKADNPYRYDTAQGVARLAHPLAQGDVVRSFPEFGLEMIRPGDTLELVSAAGAVRIERDVEALQAARPGQRLFVRARDGAVLSVRYEDVAP